MKAIIRDVLEQARRRLAEASFEPDTREASLLFGHVLGWSEARILARDDEIVEQADLRRFELMLNRRLTGEPVAYILGEREFYGRSFQVDDRVLIPRPETEHLIEMALELPLPRWPSILDLGTGSGCVACTLALELPAAQAFACDISPAALAVAIRNLHLHGLAGRLQLLASNLASAVDLTRFDLVVTNPPYVGLDEADSLSAEILEFEPETALFAGPAGDTIHRRTLSELSSLRSGCWLITEIGAGQEDLIRRLAIDSGFELEEVRPDYAGHPRVALLRRS